MRNWSDCSIFLILFLSLTILLSLPNQAKSQYRRHYSRNNISQVGLSQSLAVSARQDSADNNESFPNPKSVMYRSMMIPGWGQVVNKQIWKVPIVYGLLGGLAYYSVFLTKKYHDYRAAYYNLNQETSNDQRFGPTPSYIPESSNLNQLKTIRNTYRNRRDMVYIGFVLAYGLNIVDAYVYAHMRSFDVSKDLSMRARIKPGVSGVGQVAPGMTLSIDFITR